MARDPEMLPTAIHFDHHHGIVVPVVMRGLRNGPIDKVLLTPQAALEIAEKLVRCAKQSLQRVEGEGMT